MNIPLIALGAFLTIVGLKIDPQKELNKKGVTAKIKSESDKESITNDVENEKPADSKSTDTGQRGDSNPSDLVED